MNSSKALASSIFTEGISAATGASAGAIKVSSSVRDPTFNERHGVLQNCVRIFHFIPKKGEHYMITSIAFAFSVLTMTRLHGMAVR